MRFLTLDEVIQLHSDVVVQSGGSAVILDIGKIDSAVAQPRMTFDGIELYPSLAEKASALGFSLASNHGFEDGNKRIGHSAMETFLVLNGYELMATIDDQERMFLRLADHQVSREEFLAWVRDHIVPRKGGTSGP